MAGIVVSNKVRRLVGNRLKEIDVPTATLDTALYYADLTSKGALFSQSRVNVELNDYPVTVKNNASLALTPSARELGVVYAMNGDTKTLEEFEFQRGSSATFFEPGGAMKLADINAPRINYENGVAKGLLIEPSSANLTPDSGLINGITSFPVRSEDGITAVDTNFNMGAFLSKGVRVTKRAAAAGSTYLYKSVPATEGLPYVLSVFIKMDDGSIPTNSDLKFMFQTVQLTSFDVINYGNGVYRIFKFAIGISGPQNWGIAKYPDQSSKSFIVTGFQVEQAERVSSYIPTTESAVTRLADKVLSKRPTVVFPKNSMNVKTSEWPATWMGNGVDLLSFVNKNLLPQNSILFTGEVQKSGAWMYNVKSTAVNHGIKIPINKKIGNDYVLTFDLKYLSGANFQNVGGNCVQTITKILFDNVQQNISSTTWHNGISNALFLDNQWHTVSIFFKYDNLANIIGIEVNRYVTGSWEIFFDVRNIRMTEGNTVSPLSPAPEDYIKVDVNGNIEVSYDEPIHIQQLSLISRELNQGEV